MPTMERTAEQRAQAALAAAEGWPGVREGETLRTVELPGRTADRDGLEPALLVHGLGGSSRNWSALMELLSGAMNAVMSYPSFA